MQIPGLGMELVLQGVERTLDYHGPTFILVGS